MSISKSWPPTQPQGGGHLRFGVDHITTTPYLKGGLEQGTFVLEQSVIGSDQRTFYNELFDVYYNNKINSGKGKVLISCYCILYTIQFTIKFKFKTC
jgi:hypothetical protein